MQNDATARRDRRCFLRLGALASLAAALGCESGDGKPETVTTPPAKGGNRSRLEARREKATASKSTPDK
jgi:hypothetical protein